MNANCCKKKTCTTVEAVLTDADSSTYTCDRLDQTPFELPVKHFPAAIRVSGRGHFRGERFLKTFLLFLSSHKRTQ